MTFSVACAKPGSVLGLPLRARGVLLEHRAASATIGEAREIARARVRIPAVRDWAVDFSEPGAIWIIADAAWYRCAAIRPCKCIACRRMQHAC